MSDMLTISLFSGLATGMGGVIITFFGQPKERYLASMLGLAAGIMLAVVLFDLLPTALVFGGPFSTGLGFFAGCCVLWLMDGIMSRLYSASLNLADRLSYFRKLGYLIAIGIALHDLPEGMAIAVSYETSQQMGLIIALSIAVHNIPEGMAIAVPLKSGRVRSTNIILLLSLLGLFTPMGSLLGLLMLEQAKNYLAFLLAFAAGAMAYIVKDELLPALAGNHRLISYTGLTLGFGLIMLLTLSQA